jgi:hypothetical protein
MARAVSRRPLTANDRVPSEISPCQICGRQSVFGTVFLRVLQAFACKFHFTIAHTHHLRAALTMKTRGRSLETFQKGILFRKSGSIGERNTFTFVFEVLQCKIRNSDLAPFD